MHIAHIASEMAPFVKVGGLGDVLSGLCRQQVSRGHKVTAILPKYDLISDTCSAHAVLLNDYIFCRAGHQEYHCRIWKSEWNGVEVLLIDNGHRLDYFNRKKIYGCSDDIARFTSFCSSSIQLFRQWGQSPDLFHLHDWHTAPFAMMRDQLDPTPAASSPLVLTVHNFDYQGHLDGGNMRLFNIDPAKITSDAWQGEGVNMLKAAVSRVDYLTTVSPNYCQEVQTPLGGRGLNLQLVQKAQQKAFRGILNGIDISYWTPKNNAYLPIGFEAQNLKFSDPARGDCDQKKELKQRLGRRLKLPPSQGPWVTCVTRLVPQKGLALIEQALFKTLSCGGTFLLMGNSPIPAVHQKFEKLRQSLGEKSGARILLNYEEHMAHWLFAAADMVIVPSIFEPCGLTQMIGMRYGTIPIVRKTGGLADSVFDFETSVKCPSQRNGFCFDEPTHGDFNRALERAFGIWRRDPLKWQKWVHQVMKLDFSWRAPEKEFSEIYSNLVRKMAPKEPIASNDASSFDERDLPIALS